MPVLNGQTLTVMQLSDAQRKLGINPHGYLPAGGAAGTFLSKLTAADYNVGWVASPAPAAGNGIVVAGGTVHFAQAAAYTTGGIPFASGVATMGFDAANLFWDAANARLGLGTNAPQGRLHVTQTFSDIVDRNLTYAILNTDTVGGLKFAYRAIASSTGAAGPWNAGGMFGAYFASFHEGSGAATGLTRHMALWVTAGKGALGTGAMDAAIGLYVQVANNNAVGAITDAYAIYIPAAGMVGAITNPYGIAQVGTSELNYFAGHTALGSNAPVATTFALFGAGTNAISSLRVAVGVAPAAPVSGDIWSDGTHLYWRDNAGSTKQLDN